MLNFELFLYFEIVLFIGCIGVRFFYYIIWNNIVVLFFFYSKEERLVELNKCLYVICLIFVDEIKYLCL